MGKRKPWTPSTLLPDAGSTLSEVSWLYDRVGLLAHQVADSPKVIRAEDRKRLLVVLSMFTLHDISTVREGAIVGIGDLAHLSRAVDPSLSAECLALLYQVMDREENQTVRGVALEVIQEVESDYETGTS